MEATAHPAQRWLIALVVAVLAIMPFLPAQDHAFVWDDELTVLKDPAIQQLDAPSLAEMFTGYHAGHYSPLTRLSLALNTHFAGNPVTARGFILTNLVLHALNAALVFFLIARLLPQSTGSWRELWAALGALLYAVHPLRVESVVWVTERRDVLSLFFLLLCLLAWLRSQEKKSRLFYVLALLAFAASLLAKAWGIVLPAVLLILCWQPLQRRDWKKCLLGIIPFALLAVGFAYLAAQAQSQEAMATLEAHSYTERLMQAAWAPAFYLWKTLIPTNLSPLYLLGHDFNPWTLGTLSGALLTIGVTLFLLVKRKRTPGILAGWLIFLVLLAPVSGIAQSGSQLAADRYTYLAGIVLAYAVAAAGLWTCKALPKRAELLVVLVFLIAAAYGYLSERQTHVWENALTLWNRALAHDDRNYIAYYNRAVAGLPESAWRERFDNLNRAIELYPNYDSAFAKRGELLQLLGENEAARADFNRAIQLGTKAAQPYNNRGIARMNAGDTQGALADFDAALKRDPMLYEAYVNRGLLLQRMGQHGKALADYKTALKLKANSWQVHFNRGLLYQSLDENEAAAADFTRVIELNPTFTQAWLQRSSVYRKLGRVEEANRDAKQGLTLQNGQH